MFRRDFVTTALSRKFVNRMDMGSQVIGMDLGVYPALPQSNGPGPPRAPNSRTRITSKSARSTSARRLFSFGRRRENDVQARHRPVLGVVCLSDGAYGPPPGLALIDGTPRQASTENRSNAR